tara:strand:- start:14948 stop:15412 length:465 start_codon:yes stop_codon:yes gene_type:complete
MQAQLLPEKTRAGLAFGPAAGAAEAVAFLLIFVNLSWCIHAVLLYTKWFWTRWADFHNGAVLLLLHGTFIPILNTVFWVLTVAKSGHSTSTHTVLMLSLVLSTLFAVFGRTIAIITLCDGKRRWIHKKAVSRSKIGREAMINMADGVTQHHEIH